MKLGQYFLNMLRDTDADTCCSHMVPFDQPEAALVSYLHGDHPPEIFLLSCVLSQDMLTRWIRDVPLA